MKVLRNTTWLPVDAEICTEVHESGENFMLQKGFFSLSLSRKTRRLILSGVSVMSEHLGLPGDFDSGWGIVNGN